MFNKRRNFGKSRSVEMDPVQYESVSREPKQELTRKVTVSAEFKVNPGNANRALEVAGRELKEVFGETDLEFHIKKEGIHDVLQFTSQITVGGKVENADVYHRYGTALTHAPDKVVFRNGDLERDMTLRVSSN